MALSGDVNQRIMRVEANFDEILEDYLSIKIPSVGGVGIVNILAMVRDDFLFPCRAS